MKSAPTRSHRAIIGSSHSASVHDGPAACARERARFGVHTSRRTSLPRLTPRSLTGLPARPPFLPSASRRSRARSSASGDSSSPPTATGRNDRSSERSDMTETPPLISGGGGGASSSSSASTTTGPLAGGGGGGGAAFHPARRARASTARASNFRWDARRATYPSSTSGISRSTRSLRCEEGVLDQQQEDEARAARVREVGGGRGEEELGQRGGRVAEQDRIREDAQVRDHG